MRVGVVNPIAGTNQFHEDDIALRSHVFLWGQFFDVTEKIDIPEKMYFFPRERRTGSGSVVVQVSKYTLGYWYSKDYTIKVGDEIGKVEIQKRPSALTSRRTPTRGGIEEQDEPETIDYRTGAILMDVVNVEDWAGTKSLRARKYYEVLYTYDGTNINHIPVGDRFWTSNLQTKYKEIKESQSREKQPLRPRSASGRTTPGMRRNRPEGGLMPTMPGGMGPMGPMMPMMPGM